MMTATTQSPEKADEGRWLRPLLLLLAMVALIFGMSAGLARLGISWAPRADLAMLHGPLMISGFLGLLITVERSIAVQGRFLYVAPAIIGIGSLAVILGAPLLVAQLCWIAGAIGLTVISALITRRQPAFFTVLLLCGALCWLSGHILWLAGRTMSEVVLWWAAFIILTIAAERLELGRVLQPGRWSKIFLTVPMAVLLAVAVSGRFDGIYGALLGASLVATMFWFFRYDVARRTIRTKGLPRYTAAALLTGFVWLGLAGVMAAYAAYVPFAFSYDALLHAIFLGFTLAMVFGHAPIIFPAVLRLPIPFHNGFYVPLFLLQASLVLRIAGDLLEGPALQRIGAVANAIAIVAFLLTVASTVAVTLLKRR